MNTLKMKKQLLTSLCIISLLCSCSNQANKKEAVVDPINEINKQKADSLTKLAESSHESISELPLNYSFSMSETEVANHTNDLLNKEVLTSLGNDTKVYSYTTKKGIKVEYYLHFWYYGGRLYQFQLDVPTDYREDSIYTAIEEELNYKVDSTYKKISYWNDYPEHEEKFVFNEWFKGNQIIEFIKFYPKTLGARINYYNAPINKVASEIESQRMQDESRARLRMKDVGVENSTYDGSVSKVEAYLKSNLKDVSSYESVEWSNVTPTDNGYMVRHKYRAKNSFGTYELVNQVFYLNGNGDVIGVSAYKK